MQKLSAARDEINRIDKEIAKLFVQRMAAVKDIAYYKAKRGLPVCDKEREASIIAGNSSYIDDEDLRAYYISFLKHGIALSKEYQERIIFKSKASSGEDDCCIKLHSESRCNICDIVIERGVLNKAGEKLNLNRRVLIVTDSGVPCKYAKSVAACSLYPTVVCVEEGEQNKNFDSLSLLLKAMLNGGFTRNDCVVAVGGGVVGDLSGFAASCYMRGIDFYNIPTTLLSQLDSSIGGKTAVNYEGVKNIVGAFYQPKRVLIDANVLASLPSRQWSNGLAEALKMALTSDEKLFSLLESDNACDRIEDIIVRSLNIKRRIVEQDEKENGIRRLLNFGHTIGHGIESAAHGSLYHGECVALGMLPMCSKHVRNRIVRVMEKLDLPLEAKLDKAEVIAAMTHDKKACESGVLVVLVDEIGKGYIKLLPQTELNEKAIALINGGLI